MFSDLDVGATGGPPAAGGWATGSLIDSIRQVVLLFSAVWQAMMLVVTLVTLGSDAWLLAAAQGLVGALALVLARRRSASYLLPGGMSALALWGYLASGNLDSTLTFAACWQMNFASIVAALLTLRWYLLPLVVAQSTLASIVMKTAVPQWGLGLPISIVVTQTAIVVAIRWGAVSLLALSRDAEVALAAAESAERQERLARRLSAEIAEESRVLHDTAINTLGALVHGAGGVSQRWVREQCARDVAFLRSLRGEHPAPAPRGLADVFDLPGLPIVRRGLDDAAIAAIGSDLAPPLLAGVVACVREAVTNAAKHSGADQVVIDLSRTGDGVVIVVTDSGAGFAGTAPRGRGIDSSIRARAAELGFTAEVRSTPGRGTSVELTVPLAANRAAEASVVDDGDAERAVAALRHRAGSLWALGVTAVGVVLTLAGGANHRGALFPMVGVMLLAWTVCRFPVRGAARVARDSFLIVSTLLVFVLSAVATTFGSVGASHWQALAATGPFILLICSRPSRWLAVLGWASWIVLIGLLAVRGFEESTTAAEITIVAGGVGLGFSGVWGVFLGLVAARSREAYASRRRTFAARLETELARTAQSTYRRWLAAGLDSALLLLDAVARGEADPRDPATRAACEQEERYLRQLIAIGPELVHLGGALMAAMQQARARGVELVLRVGDADASDEATAMSVAAGLRGAVELVPPASTLVATLFPVSEGLQLTLTGRGLAALEPEASGSRREQLGPMTVLELRFAGAAGPSHGGADRSADAS